MSVTDIQHGGSHYSQGSIQPIQYIHANNLNFFEGNCVKYVTRHRNKNGVEDLKKAMHYIQMILEFEYGVKSNVDYPVPVEDIVLCAQPSGCDACVVSEFCENKE